MSKVQKSVEAGIPRAGPSTVNTAAIGDCAYDGRPRQHATAARFQLHDTKEAETWPLGYPPRSGVTGVCAK